MGLNTLFKSICSATLFIILLTPTVSAQWTTSQSEDEMSGEKRSFAFSPSVESTTRMRMPYTGTTGRLAVGCNDNSEWAYIVFSETPNLLNVTLEDGRNRIRTRMRWDDEVENVILIQTWGANTLHFTNASSAVQKMINSNEVLLELDWYGENKTYFRFSLEGSSNAVSQIRNECTTY